MELKEIQRAAELVKVVSFIKSKYIMQRKTKFLWTSKPLSQLELEAANVGEKCSVTAEK